MAKTEAHLQQISYILKDEEEECRNQLVTNPHEYYMEEKGICYHEEESPPIYWLQQYQEEERQSQLVANPNEHYVVDEGTYYHEQAVTLDEKKEE